MVAYVERWRVIWERSKVASQKASLRRLSWHIWHHFLSLSKTKNMSRAHPITPLPPPDCSPSWDLRIPFQVDGVSQLLLLLSIHSSCTAVNKRHSKLFNLTSFTATKICFFLIIFITASAFFFSRLTIFLCFYVHSWMSSFTLPATGWG